jgi:hypothetical protein
MLARSGVLPTRGEWRYEVEWDGFRSQSLATRRKSSASVDFVGHEKAPVSGGFVWWAVLGSNQ